MDKEEIEGCLNEFPNSFQLTLKAESDFKKVKKVVHTIETELSEDPVQCHVLHNKNLLSYLFWELGDECKAKEFNEYVKNEDSENIISLANFGLMHLKNDNVIQAKEVLSKLEEIKNTKEYNLLQTEGIAELAYCYTRCGFGVGCDKKRYYDKAKDMFEDVLKKQAQNWIWTFSYGLVLQRTLDVNYICSLEKFDANEVFGKACTALLSVAKQFSDNPSFVGKAWCKLGKAIHQYQCIPDYYKGQHGEHIPPPDKLTVNDCIENAIRAAENDRTVLQECGKHFRKKNSRNLPKARKCLEAALKIRPNTFVYLHLGLLEVDEWNGERRQLLYEEKYRRRAQSTSSYESKSSQWMEKGHGQGGKRNRTLSANYAGNFQTPNIDKDKPRFSLFNTTSDNLAPRFFSPQNRGGRQPVRLPRCPPPRCVVDSGFYSSPPDSLSGITSDFSKLSIVSQNKDFQNQKTTLETMQAEREVCHSVSANGEGNHEGPDHNICNELLTAYVKSQNKLAQEPGNPKLIKALKYLEKARECSVEADVVFSEMGMVNRRLANIDDAIVNFQKSAKAPNASLFSKIKSFEQRGLCNLELASKAESLEDKQKYSRYARYMFFRAIEMQTIELKFPVLVFTHSIPTLQQLLQTEKENHPRDSNILMDLSRLKRLLKDYREALSSLDDVLAIDPENKQAQLLKATTLIQGEAYEEAILYLRLLTTTVVREDVKPELFLKAYLGAAEKRLNDKEINMAQGYFRMAYSVAFLGLESDSDVAPDFAYHICVIASENDKSDIISFSEIIEDYFDLKCFSSISISMGDYIPRATANAMNASRNFLIICDSNNDNSLDYDVNQAISISKPRPKDSYSWILIGDNDAKIPNVVQHMGCQLLPGYASWPKEHNTSDFNKLVMKLFKAIIPPHMLLKAEQV